jgi:mRNA-degrading endonuclease RelE of RelBE toxin-antitoxin system
MAYEIIYSRPFEQQVLHLTDWERAIVFDALDAQFQYEPALPTKHRKRLRKNELASWRLRVGGLRVYYNPLLSKIILA